MFCNCAEELAEKLVTWVVFFGAKYSRPPITPRHYMRLLKRREWLERGASCVCANDGTGARRERWKGMQPSGPLLMNTLPKSALVMQLDKVLQEKVTSSPA